MISIFILTITLIRSDASEISYIEYKSYAKCAAAGDLYLKTNKKAVLQNFSGTVITTTCTEK